MNPLVFSVVVRLVSTLQILHFIDVINLSTLAHYDFCSILSQQMCDINKQLVSPSCVS